MQTVLTYLTLLLTGMLLHSQNTIEISMSGFDSNEGKAMIGLFKEEKTFLRNPYQSLSSEIKNNESKIVFSNIPDGVYAISVYHDENDNDKIDLIMGMIPREDTGTSNNPKTIMGPPEWEDAIFEVKGGELVHFKIIIN